MLDRETIDRMERLLHYRNTIDRYHQSGEPIGESAGFGAEYHPDFYQFREQLVKDGWLDGEYSQTEGFDYMRHQSRIDFTDVETLERLLLFCDRGEYWSGGFWADAIANGFVSRILHRMQALHDERVDA